MLQIGALQIKHMQREAGALFPDECCGFFFGKEEQGVKTVTRIEPVTNSKEGDRRRRFEIAPLDYMRAERLAEKENLQLLGVYHSHPQHPAIPSETDRLAAQPCFSYIILSVYDGQPRDIRSWVLNEEQQFEEENVVMTEQGE